MNISTCVSEGYGCLCASVYAYNRGIEGKKTRKGDREIQDSKWYLF